MRMIVVMFVLMMLMAVIVRMFTREVDIKFHAGYGGFLLARNVEMIAAEFELLQLAFQFVRIHAEVEQRGDKHIAGDAAEKVEVKNFHCRETSALIWLAA